MSGKIPTFFFLNPSLRWEKISFCSQKNLGHIKRRFTYSGTICNFAIQDQLRALIIIFLIWICIQSLDQFSSAWQIQILISNLCLMQFYLISSKSYKIFDVTSRFSASRILKKKISHYAHYDILDFRNKIDIADLWLSRNLFQRIF